MLYTLRRVELSNCAVIEAGGIQIEFLSKPSSAVNGHGFIGPLLRLRDPWTMPNMRGCWAFTL
jgi:hypothetical protein